MARKKKGDNPKAKSLPGDKSPRIKQEPPNNNELTPVWSISVFDHDGVWGRELCSKDDHIWTEIFVKLRQYETMTWSEIL